MPALTRVDVDAAAVQRLMGEAGIVGAMKALGEAILSDAQGNIVHMGAVDTGALYRSGFVDQDDSDGTTRVGFTVEYASLVHEGLGTSHRTGPRPFLANAAATNRGRLQ